MTVSFKYLLNTYIKILKCIIKAINLNEKELLNDFCQNKDLSSVLDLLENLKIRKEYYKTKNLILDLLCSYL